MAGVVQRLVDGLADRLGRAVVVDDPDLRPLCTSRHFGDEDEQRIRSVLQRDSGFAATRHLLAQGVRRWTAPAPVPADPGLGMAARLAAPVRLHGCFLGLLLVIDADHSLTGAERALIGRTADDVAVHLYAERLAADGDRAVTERAVGDLLCGQRARRQEALAVLAAAAGRPPAEAPTAVTVVEVAAPAGGGGAVDAEDALRTALQHVGHRGGGACLSRVSAAGACLVETGPGVFAAALRKRAAALVRAVDELCGGGRASAGIGDDAAGLGEAWRAHRQALVAAEAARRVPGFGPAAVWSELGPYGTLLQLPEDAAAWEPPHPALRALAERDGGGRLAETLESFLDHAGSRPRTAEALHIHRTTLYYRLDRIAEITGLDLDDGGDRLALHLALRRARIATPRTDRA
ncbi:helix-turn-helix domain-containing protein [Streptomyces sp. NPDC047002]|uniref:PucR family transcriptional regulator n=1 Tax=Streptomyces sp. NPDC047002 TaxID=3155475 RepID=UPI003456A3EF